MKIQPYNVGFLNLLKKKKREKENKKDIFSPNIYSE